MDYVDFHVLIMNVLYMKGLVTIMMNVKMNWLVELTVFAKVTTMFTLTW